MKLRTRKAYSLKDIFARINKLFVCCLKTSKRNQNHFQLLFQRLQFLDEACGIDLQYPRSQQTSMMVEIQTSFGVVKINCYGDVTVDKKVWNRIATAIHLYLLSASITYLKCADTSHTRFK